MAEMWSKDGGEPRVVVFAEPHWEDIEFSVAGEDGIERREVSKSLLHDLGARFDEDTMHSRSKGMEVFHAAGRDEQPEGVFTLSFLVERANDLAQVIDGDIGSLCPGSGV